MCASQREFAELCSAGMQAAEVAESAELYAAGTQAGVVAAYLVWSECLPWLCYLALVC